MGGDKPSNEKKKESKRPIDEFASSPEGCLYTRGKTATRSGNKEIVSRAFLSGYPGEAGEEREKKKMERKLARFQDTSSAVGSLKERERL